MAEAANIWPPEIMAGAAEQWPPASPSSTGQLLD